MKVLFQTLYQSWQRNISDKRDYRIFGEKVQKTAEKMINFTEVQQEISEDLILQELTDLEAFLGD